MQQATKRVIGVIGGSGLYQLEGLQNARWQKVTTPWGDPSDELLFGDLDGQPFVFLPRHGRGHKISPTHINFRANIAALKAAGVTDVLSMSAVGSLKEELPPGTFVVVDQFLDRTFAREKTFFGDGFVAHASMARPVCTRLGDVFEKAARDASIPVQRGGTYLVMEGPQFSSQAESRLYRSWACDVIGMTNMPEAKLAREAELCYATIAMVTDFDCWHPGHDHVTAADVVATLTRNADHARQLIRRIGPLLRATEHAPCPHKCDRALDNAVLTAPEARSPEAVARLRTIAGRLLGGPPVPEKDPADPAQINALIRTIPDFPKKGIQFRDVTTLFKDGDGFRRAVRTLAERYRSLRIDKVVGIEARGFVIGAALAYELGVGFIPVRKKGKLPGTTVNQAYALEYGTDHVEIHADALVPDERVLIVDDLIATGGTAHAAVQLVRRIGAVAVEACFMVDLPDLGGKARLEKEGVPVHCLTAFGGH